MSKLAKEIYRFKKIIIGFRININIHIFVFNVSFKIRGSMSIMRISYEF